MLKELTQITHDIIKYKIPYATFIKLQNIALTHLNLSNINHLRDKFEGQDYLNRFLLKCYAELAFIKEFQSEPFEVEIYLKYKNYKHNFQLFGEKVKLIYSDFENYPLIPRGDYDTAVVLFINLLTRETWIVGSIKNSLLKKLILNQSVSPMIGKNYLGYFKFFDDLKIFTQ